MENLLPKSSSNSSNLDLVRHDPLHGSIPKFLKEHNDFYFIGQTLVLSAIATYAALLPPGSYDRIKNFRRSYAGAEEAEAFFQRYDVEPFTIVKDDLYLQALDIVTEWFRPKSPIHPVHFLDLHMYPWNLSTSAERPFSTNNDLKSGLIHLKIAGLIDNARMSFHNLYDHIFTYCRTYTHRVKDGLKPPLHPITLHIKPALVDEHSDDKVRTIFGVPKPIIFLEAMFLWPLYSTYFKEQTSPLLWNYETLQGGWSRLNDEWISNFRSYKPVFNLDWSEFDMRVYYSMWQDCLDRIKTYFCFCGRYHPTHTHPRAHTSPNRLHNIWDYLQHAYFNTMAVSTTGNEYKRRFAGMPSGIFGTQFYDSFYNSVMVVTTLLALDHPVDPNHFIKVMGDDVIFGTLSNMTAAESAAFLDSFAIEANRRFNSKLSPTKSGVSPTIQGASILSYTNWNGYPKRDPVQLLAQLLHPKSLRDTPPRLMARAIGIYYASAGDHRLRPICEQVYSELKFQGYSPNQAAFDKLFDPRSLGLEHIDLSHFPSKTEVISRLSSPSKRNPDLQAIYWPLTHFSSEAGFDIQCHSPRSE
nr:MAG: putative RNA dependent RNA polymerase [Hanko alphapartitivirus 3]